MKYNELRILIILVIITIFLSSSLAGMEYNIRGVVSEIELQEVETLLDEGAERFLPLFKLDSNSRLEVMVCKDVEVFITLTGANWWNGGHYIFPVIYLQPLYILKERGILEETIIHEFIHYCIEKICGKGCPLWLNEGIALHFSGGKDSLSCMQRLKGGEEKKNTFFSSEILDKMISSRDREKNYDGYCLASELVEQIIREKGFDFILERLTALKTGDRNGVESLFHL